MATIDPFSAEIVRLVRSMSDDAILALVKNQLGSGTGAAIASRAARAVAAGRVGTGRRGRPAKAIELPAAAPGKPGRKPGRPAKVVAAKPGRKPGPKPVAAKGKPGPKKGGRGRGAGGAGRQELLSNVERVVKSGGGLSASEIAKSAGVPQTRVTSALKELKLAKRIFQGGDRRFARYAGDARSAEAASVSARQNAAGPMVKKGKRK
ncbi:MAG: hypothetical protein HOW73_28195 [Polyangiaceae bacterium]|nr:hypothetical protein [Polyangiaceae bacterium]